jgi:hypothetical protein
MQRLLRFVVWLASAAAIVGISTLGVRAALSSRPPTPVESEVLVLAGRLAHHGPLYLEPDVLHPASVMPVVPLAAQMLVDTWGPHLWLIRLLTLLALLGVAGIVATIVHVETESRTLAVAAAGLMLAGHLALGGQPGVAAPEPLMLALVLAGFLSLRTVSGASGAIIAALLVSVACFTEQRAIGFAAAGGLYLALEGRGRLPAYVLGIALVGGGGYLGLSRLLGPWFNFYAWDVPVRSLELAPTRLLDYLGGELLGTLGALTLVAVLGFALPREPWPGPVGLWMCMGAAAVGAGLVATQSGGRGPYATLTSVAALALIGPIALKHVTEHLSAWPGSNRMGGRSVLFVVLALQFVALFARLSPLRLPAGG